MNDAYYAREWRHVLRTKDILLSTSILGKEQVTLWLMKRLIVSFISSFPYEFFCKLIDFVIANGRTLNENKGLFSCLMQKLVRFNGLRHALYLFKLGHEIDVGDPRSEELADAHLVFIPKRKRKRWHGKTWSSDRYSSHCFFRCMFNLQSLGMWRPSVHASFPRESRRTIEVLMILAHARGKDGESAYKRSGICFLPDEVLQYMCVWAISPPYTEAWWRDALERDMKECQTHHHHEFEAVSFDLN